MGEIIKIPEYDRIVFQADRKKNKATFYQKQKRVGVVDGCDIREVAARTLLKADTFESQNFGELKKWTLVLDLTKPEFIFDGCSVAIEERVLMGVFLCLCAGIRKISKR